MPITEYFHLFPLLSSCICMHYSTDNIILELDAKTRLATDMEQKGRETSGLGSLASYCRFKFNCEKMFPCDARQESNVFCSK